MFQILSILDFFMLVFNISGNYEQGSLKAIAGNLSKEKRKERLKQQQDSEDFLLFEGNYNYNEVRTGRIEHIAFCLLVAIAN